MTNPLETPETQFALDAVREASHLVCRVQAEMVGESLAKDDRSPVTVADFAAQALVACRLAARFPDAVLIGEESADALRTGAGEGFVAAITRFVQQAVPEATAAQVLDWIDRGSGDPPDRFWTLDPIDGTKGFLRGDQYAVCLALVDQGQVELGVLGCPQLSEAHRPDQGGSGTLLCAQRGRGSWHQPLVPARPEFADGVGWQVLRVSEVCDPVETRMLRSVESAHTNTGTIGELATHLGIQAPPVPMDSQAKYAVLAAGQGDMLVRLLSPSRPDYREKIWDQAAGSIVVEEAGGRVTDLSGKALDFSQGRTLANNRGVLASNGHLHEAFLEALAVLGA